MSGSHREEYPGDQPGDGGFDGAAPPDGYGSDGPDSQDWFRPRQANAEPPYGAGGFTGASDPGGYSAGGYGQGGFTGASDPGGFTGPAEPRGYGLGSRGRTPAEETSGPPGAARSGSTGGHRAGPVGGSGAGSGSDGFDDYGGYGGYGTVPRDSDAAAGSGAPGDQGGSGHGGSGRGGRGAHGGGRGGQGSGPQRRRSLSALIGPMAGAIGLALLLGVGVYAFAQRGGCSGDAITLNVSAAPDIAPAVNATATRFNRGHRKVNGHCVRAAVTSADPAAVATLLSGQGVSGTATQPPDVWIPDSSLWTSLVRASAKGAGAVQVTRTSVAQSPLVLGMPPTLVSRLRRQGVNANPSWDNVLKAAGGAGITVSKNQLIPPNLIKLKVLDPSHTAGGMASLMLTHMLLANDPNAQNVFTGIVRSLRENIAPDVSTQFASFGKVSGGRYPVVLAPEQAVWKHNQGHTGARAVAIYPVEGTATLDYPYTVTNGQGDKAQAAKLLEQALGTADAQKEVRARGFRAADGTAPASFGPETGLNPKAPRALPVPQPLEVRAVMQAWAKLSLSVRMLALLDVSGSMADVVPGTKVTRMQATTQVAQGGLSLLPNDTELGLWTFSTQLAGDRPWRQDVSLGPLGQRIGPATRRQLVLAALAGLRPKPNGNTGLYDSILAAFRTMKNSYKPEMINSLLLLTDGRNDNPQGITLQQLLTTLKKEFDPNRPVQVIMIGFGAGVDRGELDQIAKATRGSVHIAHTPTEIQKIFLSALSRRVCAPNC